MDATEIAAREAGLHKALSRAQLVMIGLGGAIGTGLFLGSSVAIGYAGPAVIVSYLIAAIAAAAMVFSLSEMAVVHPTAGSFGTYAEKVANLMDCRCPLARAPQRGVLRRQARTGARYHCA